MIKTIKSNTDNLIDEISKNEQLRETYINMLEDDYIYYYSKDMVHYFAKRSHFISIYGEVLKGNLHTNCEQIYSLDVTEVNPTKMLVIFGSMPDAQKYRSSSVANRMFVKNVPHIRKYIPDDVLIIRFIDLNFHSGSFYLSTKNNPRCEDNVYKVIKLVAKENGISSDDILFFGTSKGGTASLYYGLKYGISFIANDPIISLINSDENRLRVSFTSKDYVFEKFKTLGDKNTYGTIICSKNVEKNYDAILEFTKYRNKIKIIDNKDKRIKRHVDVMFYSQKYIYNAAFNFFYDENLNTKNCVDITNSTVNVAKHIKNLDFKTLNNNVDKEFEKFPKNNVQLLLFYLDIGKFNLFKKYYYLCDLEILVENCFGNKALEDRIKNLSFVLPNYWSFYSSNFERKDSLKILTNQLHYIDDIVLRRAAIVCYFNRILITSDQNLLVEFIEYIAKIKILSPIQEKYIFVSIFDYYIEKDISFLKLQAEGYYSHYEKLVYLLTANNYEYYKDGILRYYELLSNINEI